MVAKRTRQANGERASRKVPAAVARGLAESSGNLVAWRKLRGLTQSQLADRAGVAVNTVRRLEDGDGGVSFENVLRVLRALGILANLSAALDPYGTDLGRLRSEERLPERVRPKKLS
jgi:transcriptional regulator with XRE-family HTH domain